MPSMLIAIRCDDSSIWTTTAACAGVIANPVMITAAASESLASRVFHSRFMSAPLPDFVAGIFVVFGWP
jgi:hypothetical protein